MGWVGLDLYDGLDWVEFFLTHHGRLGRVGLDLYDGLGWVGLGWIFFDPPWWVGSKNSLNPTRPNPTLTQPYFLFLITHIYEAAGLGNAICINYTLQLSNSWDLWSTIALPLTKGHLSFKLYRRSRLILLPSFYRELHSKDNERRWLLVQSR